MLDCPDTVRPAFNKLHFVVVFVVRVPAQVNGEAKAALLGVAHPALLVPTMGQVSAAHPLLELPEVAPQLVVLQGATERRDKGSSLV